VGNTHTETSVTGTSMTRAYHYAQKIIKRHVNAGPDDIPYPASRIPHPASRIPHPGSRI